METTTTLRLATPGDAGEVAAIYAPIIRDTVISFETAEISPEQMRDRVTATLRTYPWLVAERDGAVAGYAYAAQHRTRAAYGWSVDVSVYLAEHARGAGIGRALYVALLDLLIAQGYANAYAGIALPNAASVGMHEALGFTPVGVFRSVGWKLGAWHDVGWWQRQLATLDAPAPPRALPELDGQDVTQALAAGSAALRPRA